MKLRKLDPSKISHYTVVILLSAVLDLKLSSSFMHEHRKEGGWCWLIMSQYMNK